MSERTASGIDLSCIMRTRQRMSPAVSWKPITNPTDAAATQTGDGKLTQQTYVKGFLVYGVSLAWTRCRLAMSKSPPFTFNVCSPWYP